jgi:L-rhamnose isomerase/sugar isomerase
MTTLFLVRHGETIWHAENRYAGSTDVALTELGIAQAERLARWAEVQPIDAVYASDLSRAVITATPSATALGLPISVDAALREVNFGRGEGLTSAEMRVSFPEETARFVEHPGTSPLPGGESGVDAAERAWGALERIVAQHPTGTVLVVMHSTLMRLILCRTLGMPLDRYRTALPAVLNVSITTVSWTADGTALLGYNVPITPRRGLQSRRPDQHPQPEQEPVMTTFESIEPLLAQQAIELPSWAFGNSGTRFKVFGTPGTPRTPQEKIADAAQVNTYTGLSPTVALHIPWDKVDDYAALGAFANDHGVALGTINSNTFQDDDYKFGSLTHVDPTIRQKAIDHHFECIDIMHQTGSRDLKVWLADGTNYPGQGDLRGRQDRLADSLARIYARIGESQRLVLEYKFFEPAFYHTDVPDWGTSYAQVSALGDRALVCLDTGHHAPGTNIEFIVMQLLRLGKLGSFDFNSRFYADDDLIVGAADPFQLFRILYEVIRGGGYGPDSGVAFMLDQCHNVEDKIPGQIRSVLNVQEMTARALLVDTVALTAAQAAGDVLGANGILMDAFYTDVRPDLAAWRESRGLPGDPMAAYAASGYEARIAADRVGGVQGGWGA